MTPFVVCMLHGQRTVAIVVKENAKTVWVRLGSGKTIQRHRVKHRISAVSPRP